MPLDVFVVRGAGDQRGEDIVDPLIGTRPAAIERGRNELDEQASRMQATGLRTTFRVGVRLGQLGSFYDSQNGVVWRGKIAGITHSYQSDNTGKFTLITTLRIQRPTENL